MDSRWSADLGIALMHQDVPAHAVGWARAAQAAGLGSAWIIEDYFHPGAFALAGAVAAATDRLTVGLGVVNPYTRHPALLAMETAALAGVAPGRVVLGLGSSNRHWIEGQMGVPFRTPLAAVRECVEIVRRLLRGERVTLHGGCFSVDGVRLETVPTQEVPVVLGVKGPKALAMAAEIGDGVLGAVLSSPAHVRRLRAAVGAKAALAAYVPMVIAEDGTRARAQVRPLLARYLGLLHGQSILADAGFGPERTRVFRDAATAGADGARHVTDEMIDALAVAGTPADCRRALARYAEAGLDAPVAVVPRDADMTEQIRRLGELAPAWRAVK